MIRTDQIVYGVLFLIPFVLLMIDWNTDSLWTERAVRYFRVPWCVIAAGWIIWMGDWGAFAIAVPTGVQLFFNERLKEDFPRR